MSVDWATVAVSGALSAFIGTVVSLLAVPQATIRQRRAERRDTALQAIAALAEPQIARLTRYRHVRPGRPSRNLQTGESQDYLDASHFILAASPLGLLRRWLVTRRVRRIFGDYWTDLARDYPTTRPETAVTTVLMAEAPNGKNVDGLLHRAYSTLPPSPEFDKVLRELRHLRAAR